MKKALSLFLTLLMIFSLSAVAFAAGGEMFEYDGGLSRFLDTRDGFSIDVDPSVKNSSAVTGIVFEVVDDLSALGTRTLDVSSTTDGSVLLWTDGSVVHIASTEKIVLPENADKLFANLPNAKFINFNDSVSFEKVVSMKNIFASSGFTSIDLSNVTAPALKYMDGAFLNSGYVTEISLENFYAPSLKSINGLFSGASSLEKVELRGFTTSSVEDMSNLFSGCAALKEVDLSNFYTGSATLMNNMFAFSGLTKLDIVSFDTSNVTGMAGMFNGCSGLADIQFGTGFSTSKVTTMSDMFRGTALKKLDVSFFDTSKVTNMERMFAESKELEYFNLSGFDTSSVTTMANMFNSCGAKELDLTSFDISSAVTLNGMMANCNILEVLDISGWYFSKNLTDLNRFLSGCTNLKRIYIYNTSYDYDIPATKYNAFDGVSKTEVHAEWASVQTRPIWTKFFNEIDAAVFKTDNFEIYANCEDVIEIYVGTQKSIEFYTIPGLSQYNFVASTDNENVLEVAQNEVNKNIFSIVGLTNGTATLTVRNSIMSSNGTEKTAEKKIKVIVKGGAPEAPSYKVTFKLQDPTQYYYLSIDGGENYYIVHDGATWNLKEGTELRVIAKNSAMATIFIVNGVEMDNNLKNELIHVVNKDKVIEIRTMDIEGNDTLNFFERLLNAIKAFFQKLANLFK